MSNELTIIQADSISAVTRAEMESQVDIAKRYPRNLRKSLETIKMMATLDPETAESCFYALKRGEGNDEKIIEGLSVRFAEIIVSSWGNLRIGTRVVSNDGRKITLQGVCHDLETNVFVSKEVVRSITTKKGFSFSEDMQTVTANAGQSIAYRNAVLAVIPRALTKKIVEEVKQLSIEEAGDLTKRRENAITYYRKQGVTDQELLNHLNIASLSDIDAEQVFYLSGLKNAIVEGSTTIHETFRKAAEDKIDHAKEVTKPASMDALNKLGKLKSEQQAGKKDEPIVTGPVVEQPSESPQVTAGEQPDTDFPKVDELSKNGSRDAKNAKVLTDFLKSKIEPAKFDELLLELELPGYIGYMDFSLRAKSEDVVAVFQQLI